MSSGGTPQQDIGAKPPPLSDPSAGGPPADPVQVEWNGFGFGHGGGWSYNGVVYKTQAEAQAAQTTYQKANPVTPSSPHPDTYGTSGPSVTNTGSTTQDPSGGITLNKTPTEQELANQVTQEYQTEIQATQAKQATAIGGLKAKETAAEGSIKANTASRGLKLGSGSALMEMVTQQERGGQAIQYQTQQGGAAISGMQQEQAAALGKAALSATEQQQQNSQAMSNAWLQAFTFAAGTAIDILSGGATIPLHAAVSGMAAGSTSDLQNLSQFG